MHTGEDALPETNIDGNNEEENENDTKAYSDGSGTDGRGQEDRGGNGEGLLGEGGETRRNGENARYIGKNAAEKIRRLQSEGAGRILQEAEYSDEIKQGIAAAKALGASDIFVIDGTIRIMVNLPDDPSFFL
ncbi:MAG: hypothetical protein VB039_08830 [Oscillospiraceae bacterium]|nr:hypothetical protein [Oscillospiraceae bacterium]